MILDILIRRAHSTGRINSTDAVLQVFVGIVLILIPVFMIAMNGYVIIN